MVISIRTNQNDELQTTPLTALEILLRDWHQFLRRNAEILKMGNVSIGTDWDTAGYDLAVLIRIVTGNSKMPVYTPRECPTFEVFLKTLPKTKRVCSDWLRIQLHWPT